jgi:pterin-4a-carbinolamine dehydratase
MKKNLAFISYRRDDEGPSARFIKAELERYFGTDQIFMDVDNIRGGENWKNTIDENLENATILIAVIGRNWLQIHDEFFRRRIDGENDWVRREIEFAIEKKITLIPFLIGSKMPKEEALPDSLKKLAEMNFLSLSVEDWRSDIAKLFNILKKNNFLVNHTILPMPEPDSNAMFPPPLKPDRVTEELKEYPGWKILEYYSREVTPQPGLAIEKIFEFKSFEKAIEFIATVSRYISEIQHHPEWENLWTSVRVRLSTWDLSHKITELDISLAKYMETKYSEINQ